MIQYCVPKGGFLVHARVQGRWEALCGYKPSAPNHHLMRNRSGWYNTNKNGHGRPFTRPCKKCHKEAVALILGTMED